MSLKQASECWTKSRTSAVFSPQGDLKKYYLLLSRELINICKGLWYKMQYKKVPIQEDYSLVTTNISPNKMCSSSACCFIEWRRITVVLFFTFWLCHLPGYQFPNWISSRVEPRTWQWKCGVLNHWATRELHDCFFIYTILFPPALWDVIDTCHCLRYMHDGLMHSHIVKWLPQ